MDRAQRRPFGEVLRGLRVAAGLSQEELAERAQLSRHTISNLERGAAEAPYRSARSRFTDAAQAARRPGVPWLPAVPTGRPDIAECSDATFRVRP